MYISKTKTYSYSLAELKEDLKIGIHDSSYDAEVVRIYKQAVLIAEKFTDFDIAQTQNILMDYSVHACSYNIFQPNITIQSISGTSSTGTVSAITGFETRKYNQYTQIKFNTSINAEILTIVYQSGYSSIPEDVKRAIAIKMRELFDTGDQYLPNTLQSSKAFERILSPYKQLL